MRQTSEERAWEIVWGWVSDTEGQEQLTAEVALAIREAERDALERAAVKAGANIEDEWGQPLLAEETRALIRALKDEP